FQTTPREIKHQPAENAHINLPEAHSEPTLENLSRQAYEIFGVLEDTCRRQADEFKRVQTEVAQQRAQTAQVLADLEEKQALTAQKLADLEEKQAHTAQKLADLEEKQAHTAQKLEDLSKKVEDVSTYVHQELSDLSRLVIDRARRAVNSIERDNRMNHSQMQDPSASTQSTVSTLRQKLKRLFTFTRLGYCETPSSASDSGPTTDTTPGPSVPQRAKNPTSFDFTDDDRRKNGRRRRGAGEKGKWTGKWMGSKCVEFHLETNVYGVYRLHIFPCI
ncbi:hypothetical protein HK102_002003, partial [Quaeritorhiza haematococci]